MKSIVLSLLILFSLAAAAQDVSYIYVRDSQINHQMKAQQKNHSKNSAGKFIEDDSTTITYFIFAEDSADNNPPVYGILKWVTGSKPSSVPAGYTVDNQNPNLRIFTDTQVFIDYLNEVGILPPD